MSAYNEGDLVEAVKGESVVRGRLHSKGDYRYLGDAGALDQLYLRDGWIVTVIERAKPKLPTAIDSIVSFRNEGGRLVAIRISTDEWLVSGFDNCQNDAWISGRNGLVIL